jgi:hypothetical protein
MPWAAGCAATYNQHSIIITISTMAYCSTHTNLVGGAFLLYQHMAAPGAGRVDQGRIKVSSQFDHPCGLLLH